MNALRLCVGLIILAVCGCAHQSQNSDSTSSSAHPTKMSSTTQSSAASASARAIRIDAGSATPFVDADGNTWKPDAGFSGGGMVNRGNINIENTRNPALYRTE